MATALFATAANGFVTGFNVAGHAVHSFFESQLGRGNELAAIATVIVLAAALSVPMTALLLGLWQVAVRTWRAVRRRPAAAAGTATAATRALSAPAPALAAAPADHGKSGWCGGCWRWRGGGGNEMLVLKLRRRGADTWLRLTVPLTTVRTYADFLARIRMKLAMSDAEARAGAAGAGAGVETTAEDAERIKIVALLVHGDERLDSESWQTLRNGDSVEVVEKSE